MIDVAYSTRSGTFEPSFVNKRTGMTFADIRQGFVNYRNTKGCNMVLTFAAFTTFSSVSLTLDQPPGMARAGAKKTLRIAVRSFIVD